MSSNQPFLGVPHPSVLHPSLPSSILLHDLSLFSGYSSNQCLPVPLEQKLYESPTSSFELKSVLGQDFFYGQTQTSTGHKDTHSVTVAGFSREQKPKTEMENPPPTNFEHSFFCYLDSESKTSNHPTNKKRRSCNYTPQEMKDDMYLDKRRRNNLSAKKWRDAKRRRADYMIQRLSLLEIENIRLRLELSCLREQNERLRIFFSQHYPT